MKKCCKDCGEEKSLDEFYKHSGMADGHLNSCKSCRRFYMANRPKECLSEIDKKRGLKASRRRKKTLYSRKTREQNPEKYAARSAVSNALRDGRLNKGVCCVCGVGELIEAHHEDYKKPLEVKWMCQKHHKELHWAEDNR